jgi:hypothetical protein
LPNFIYGALFDLITSRGTRRATFPSTVGGLVIGVTDGDLVAEESRRAGPRMGDERLVRRQVQLEVVSQELCHSGFDLFGFGLGSDESK